MLYYDNEGDYWVLQSIAKWGTVRGPNSIEISIEDKRAACRRKCSVR